MPSMDILSDSAKRIGAVNTVTKQPDGKLHGDNTDWLGIKNQFESRLMARGGWAPATTTARRGTVAMLCGAGGTAKAAAYCFEQMGCSHVIIMNRTLTRAEALAKVSAFASIVMQRGQSYVLLLLATSCYFSCARAMLRSLWFDECSTVRRSLAKDLSQAPQTNAPRLWLSSVG